MTTVLPYPVILTPVGSVDTSSASHGVSMFSFFMDQLFNEVGNPIQFEYWISTSDPSLEIQQTTGFIALEDAVTCQGISNQFTIAIPASTNDYDSVSEFYVQMRVYIGATGSSIINVSGWSNQCPLHPPPAKPLNPQAFIYRGEPYGYDVDDMLCVKIDNSVAYNDDIKFVVSYNYVDQSGGNQWIVSTPQNWTVVGRQIIIDSIRLASDVAYPNSIYVAVNALFTYEYPRESSINYYSMSEISSTVVATNADFRSPTLNTITIPTDYYIYNDDVPSQTVYLSWEPPENEGVPGYSVSGYKITLNSQLSYTVNVDNDVTNYNYPIPERYITATQTTTLSFNVVAVYQTGEERVSNTETVNTFTYATAPVNLQVAWANKHVYDDRIDIGFTFNNPEYNGFGTNPVFNLILKLNGQAVGDIYTVTYAARYPYVQYLTDVPTSNSMELYMVTTNTNATTGSVPVSYSLENGVSTTDTFTPSNVPYVYNVSNSEAQFTFNVISDTMLSAVCSLDVWNGLELEALPFLTDPNLNPDHPDYIIEQLDPLPTGDLQYAMTFYPGFFPDSVIPAHVMVNCANVVGIGAGNGQRYI